MLINLNLFCKIHGIEKFRELHAGTFHGKKNIYDVFQLPNALEACPTHLRTKTRTSLPNLQATLRLSASSLSRHRM